MYNTKAYNTLVYNNKNLGPIPGDQDDIVFNGYSLQTLGITSSILIQDNMPKRAFDTFDIPRGDGQGVIGDYWREKIIAIDGVIHKETNSELEAEIEDMKEKLSIQEGILDIKIDGVIRRYIATLTNSGQIFSRRRGFHVSFCPFELEFYCADPFGRSVGYASLFDDAVLGPEYTNVVVHEGNAEAKPVLILYFGFSDVSQIIFKNNTRDEAITLDESIGTFSIVIFNSETKQVTVNGVVKDYTGSFPLLSPGSNSFTIETDGAAPIMDITLKYKQTYL